MSNNIKSNTGGSQSSRRHESHCATQTEPEQDKTIVEVDPTPTDAKYQDCKSFHQGKSAYNEKVDGITLVWAKSLQQQDQQNQDQLQHQQDDTAVSSDEREETKSLLGKSNFFERVNRPRYKICKDGQPKRKAQDEVPESEGTEKTGSYQHETRKRPKSSVNNKRGGNDVTAKSSQRKRKIRSSSSFDSNRSISKKKRKGESTCAGTDGSKRKSVVKKRDKTSSSSRKKKNTGRKGDSDRKSTENKKKTPTPKRKT